MGARRGRRSLALGRAAAAAVLLAAALLAPGVARAEIGAAVGRGGGGGGGGGGPTQRPLSSGPGGPCWAMPLTLRVLPPWTWTR